MFSLIHLVKSPKSLVSLSLKWAPLSRVSIFLFFFFLNYDYYEISRKAVLDYFFKFCWLFIVYGSLFSQNYLYYRINFHSVFHISLYWNIFPCNHYALEDNYRKANLYTYKHGTVIQ